MSPCGIPSLRLNDYLGCEECQIHKIRTTVEVNQAKITQKTVKTYLMCQRVGRSDLVTEFNVRLRLKLDEIP